MIRPCVIGRFNRSAIRVGHVRSITMAPDSYTSRHIGPRQEEIKEMIEEVGYKSVEQFVEATMPSTVLVNRPLKISPAKGFTEPEAINRLKEIASKNKIYKSLIGRGYYGTILPNVILRNLLENPNWYTSYTPYQPEISQGRLESLLNFQTMVTDLTGMDIANASLLDEATAAQEAMVLSFGHGKRKKHRYLVDENVLTQTVDVIKTRAKGLNITVEQVDLSKLDKIDDDVCGVLASYPGADGSINDWSALAQNAKAAGALTTITSDLLALTILEPPTYADVVVGSCQRFGVPMGFGGPHAGFFAVKDEFKRKIPGRIIGVSKDRLGDPAYRLALQTREQHIRRDKATSNICTAQALLANISAMYAVYHGSAGLKVIANRVHDMTSKLAAVFGSHLKNKTFFDTLTVSVDNAEDVRLRALQFGFNIWTVDKNTISISLDEQITADDFQVIYDMFDDFFNAESKSAISNPIVFPRSKPLLQEPVFNKHHSETDMMRYLTRLQAKDLSLADAMIPLGSCTMKLNAATAMAPITWPEFTEIHPFVPRDQAIGYLELIRELEDDLAEITGFAGTSLQPNSGAQGEFTGLRTIKAYLEAKGQGQRDVCLIPVSAHGTNPASAAVAGMKIIPVKCLSNGELDISDLEEKATKHSKDLAALMVTYPSTFGVYEPRIRDAIDIIHKNGGQVYMDGANMNAQVGLTSPGDLGADVCHLNLHKTFSIPHGGGGPGVGPICVAQHLVPYLPGHKVIPLDHEMGAVSAAPYGSALILPISWSYIKMLGPHGLRASSIVAMLNANYLKKKLEPYYDIVFENSAGLCAHEFILDIRPFKSCGVEAIDVAKRLQDYGFHAPTMSWPVPNTLMVEPTESEPKSELDRFISALISIRGEIKMIEDGTMKYENSVLANAPHSAKDLINSEWNRPYTRAQAAYPTENLLRHKFWPAVTRVDDSYGDKNLICTCGSVENYA